MNALEEPDFSGLATSYKIETPQKVYQFSTFDDYAACLLEKGACVAECDLRTNETLVRSIHKHWHRQGQSGCWFAQDFTKSMVNNEWRTVVLPLHHAKDFVDRLCEEIRTAIVSVECQILSVILPRITTPSELVTLIRQLSCLKDWKTEVAQTDVICFGLRIPLQEACWSWVLGFGPFTFLPPTRQAPFTELAIRTKPQKQTLSHPELNTDDDAAHLADVPSGFNQAKFDKCMANTTAAKKRILGCDNSPIAKAKVTFVIPTGLWVTS